MNKLLLVIFLLVGGAGCTSRQQEPADLIKLVSPTEFKQLLEKEKGMLLDVRTPGEWKKGHIEGAVHLDIFRDDFEEEIDKLDTNAVYFVYCASGGRSSEAAAMMNKKGFRLIYDMDGGFSKWKNDSLPYEQ